MEIVVVKLSELMQDNPTLCLSPLRVTGKCLHCKKFKDALRANNNDIHKILEGALKCKPKVNPNLIELFERKKELLDELREINKKLEEV